MRAAAPAAVAFSLFLAFPALVGAGQDQSSTAAPENRNQVEKAGDAVGGAADDAARKGGKAADSTGDAAREAGAKARDAAQ